MPTLLPQLPCLCRLLPVVMAVECYNTDGSVNTNRMIPCNANGTAPFQCCYANDGCASNGLCIGYGTSVFYGACTVRNWASVQVETCPSACINCALPSPGLHQDLNQIGHLAKGLAPCSRRPLCQEMLRHDLELLRTRWHRLQQHVRARRLFYLRYIARVPPDNGHNERFDNKE
jgi:hypothetical protein